MKSMIKTFILAVLAMAFTAFPAVAADQTKQVKKPQIQRVAQNTQQTTTPSWVGNLACGGTAEECKNNKNKTVKKSSMRDTYMLMKGK